MEDYTEGNGTIHAAQPALIAKAVAIGGLYDAKPRHYPLPKNPDFDPPTTAQPLDETVTWTRQQHYSHL